MDTLQTERLLIRPFTMDDLEEAHELLDLDIQWAGPGFTLEQRRAKLQTNVCLARWEDTGKIYGSRALILKKSGQMIGIMGLHPDLWSQQWKRVFWPPLLGLPEDDTALAHVSPELGIGYALSNQCRGQGYAAEAVRTMLAHAFGELDMQRVFAMTDRANTNSVRLMQRVGMRTFRNSDAEVVYPATVGVIAYPGGLV
jgi:RimJ/RimL family protein N-acetyltransferase